MSVHASALRVPIAYALRKMRRIVINEPETRYQATGNARNVSAGAGKWYWTLVQPRTVRTQTHHSFASGTPMPSRSPIRASSAGDRAPIFKKFIPSLQQKFERRTGSVAESARMNHASPASPASQSLARMKCTAADADVTALLALIRSEHLSALGSKRTPAHALSRTGSFHPGRTKWHVYPFGIRSR